MAAFSLLDNSTYISANLQNSMQVSLVLQKLIMWSTPTIILWNITIDNIIKRFKYSNGIWKREFLFGIHILSHSVEIHKNYQNLIVKPNFIFGILTSKHRLFFYRPKIQTNKSHPNFFSLLGWLSYSSMTNKKKTQVWILYTNNTNKDTLDK